MNPTKAMAKEGGQGEAREVEAREGVVVIVAFVVVGFVGCSLFNGSFFF